MAALSFCHTCARGRGGFTPRLVPTSTKCGQKSIGICRQLKPRVWKLSLARYMLGCRQLCARSGKIFESKAALLALANFLKSSWLALEAEAGSVPDQFSTPFRAKLGRTTTERRWGKAHLEGVI